jgi:hypothetical protein
MKKISLLFAACFLPLVFSACSTPAKKEPMPPPATQLGTDAATVYFIRPNGAPAAVKGTLSLDGHPLGKIFVRRYAVINVAPGRHEFDFSFSGWVAVPAQSAVLNCEPGKKYFLCYTTQMGIGAIVPVAPTVILSITPNLQLLEEKDARQLMTDFEHALTFGEIISPDPSLKTAEPAEPTPAGGV